MIKKTIYTGLLIATIAIAGCNGKKQNGATDTLAKDTLAFDTVMTDTVSLIQKAIYKSRKAEENGFESTAGTSQRSTWLELFKNCYESDLIARNKIINNNLLYFGPSSNIYLGTVIDKHSLSNQFDVKTDMRQYIPQADFSKFVSTGIDVSDCNLSTVKDADASLSLILSGVLQEGLTDSLGISLSKWDSLKVTGGKWRVDYIRESDFLRYLEKNSQNDDIRFLKEEIFDKQNLVVTKVVKVTGFTAKAFYKGEFSAGLNAALKNPLTVKLATDTSNASKDPLMGRVTFKKKSSKEVEVSSTNSFYIFGNVKAGKKL